MQEYLSLVAVQLLMVACTHQPTAEAPRRIDLAWPPPPSIARIVYVDEIRAAEDVGVADGLFSVLVRAFRGTEERDIERPYGLAVTDNGQLLVVDNAYNAVHRFDTRRREYTRIPRRPMENFRNPVNIALGSDERIFISDSVSGLVHVFEDTGDRFVTSIGRQFLQRPTGVAVNPVTGELLVVDTKASMLVVFDEKTLEFKRSVGGNYQVGQNNLTFHYPTNISVARDGTVYVTDSLNFRIQALSSKLEQKAEFGRPGNAPGQFSRPKGLATDSDGHIYVIDAIFDNIQVFEPDGSLLIAFGGPGKNAGEFWMPNAIWIDASDRIYVSDAYNQRVQVFQYLKNEISE